jgi:hypothetical protein
MYTAPSVSDFKNYFVRDFPYGVDIDANVLDSDIQRALDQAACQISQGLFCDQSEYTTGYLLLAAHILVLNIQSSSMGLQSSFTWNETSKSVGSVSVSQTIPEQILKNPLYAWYSRTGYGSQYLMIVFPRIQGQIFTVLGRTLP